MSKNYIISYSISFILLIGIGIKCYRILHPNEVGISLEQEVRHLEQDVTFGNEGEPIFMYFSYKCMYCQKFFKEVFPDLKRNNIDTKKNRLVIKFIEPNNDTAMLNALQLISCAAQYGNFQKLHELLLFNCNIVYKNDFTILIDDIVQQNQSIAECYFENQNYQYLKGNYEEYVKNNITGTPAFIYKNKLYKGFHNFEELKKIINN